MTKIIGYLRVLFSPGCWMTVGRYSKIWDERLNDLMRLHSFEAVDRFTAKIGPETVWIRNHPYASFKTYRIGAAGPIPKRITMLKAMDQLDADSFAPVEKGQTP